ncbi:Uncharacterised protein [uncultured archaeon]|nr:Uncharacterised protein [uncultured archaeon]
MSSSFRLGGKMTSIPVLNVFRSISFDKKLIKQNPSLNLRLQIIKVKITLHLEREKGRFIKCVKKSVFYRILIKNCEKFPLKNFKKIFVYLCIKNVGHLFNVVSNTSQITLLPKDFPLLINV